jgi:rod shape-determining protein MreC
MPKYNHKFFISLAIGAILLVALNAFWLHWFRPHVSWGSTWGASLFSESSRFHSMISSFANWKELARENDELKARLSQGTADSTLIAQLEKENNQLKTALGLSKGNSQSIPVGIYNIILAPDGYTALLNKGADYQVSVGDLVIDENRVLIGSVQAVFAHSSRVTLISDPSFKVTVQVLGGSAKGIAHGALDKGMTLDLVIQSDEIHEGDILVTSGDDMVPGGLIIGAVSHVEANSAKLFKQVQVSPHAQFITGSAYILP